MTAFKIAIFWWVSSVFGADLTFLSDTNCTGQPLYGRKELPGISCYDMSYLDPTKSVILANVAPGETVTFFSDTACTNNLYSYTIDVCYTEPDHLVRGFSVKSDGTSANAPASTKDVVPYGVRLSNYKGLSIATVNSPDIGFSRFSLGIALGAAGGSITIAAFAIGCATIDTTNALSKFGCVAAPIATIIGYVGSYIAGSGGAAIGQTVNQNLNMALGNINNVRKRHMINNANFEYLSGIMRRDGIDAGEHVAFQTRDMGNGIQQRSPLFEIDGIDGKYHTTAFYDERSGSFIHHMHRAAESNLTIRYDKFHRRQISYDDVRWNSNGLDWSVCAFGGSTSGWSTDPASNWQTAFDQLSCQYPESNDGGLTTTVTNIEVDLYNETPTIIGSIQIVAYDGSPVTPPSCANPSTSLNEDCIIA